MTKPDAGLITPLPVSDSGSSAVWGSKRINPRPQSCLCLAWSGYPSNDDDDEKKYLKEVKQTVNMPNNRQDKQARLKWGSQPEDQAKI